MENFFCKKEEKIPVYCPPSKIYLDGIEKPVDIWFDEDSQEIKIQHDNGKIETLL